MRILILILVASSYIIGSMVTALFYQDDAIKHGVGEYVEVDGIDRFRWKTND